MRYGVDELKGEMNKIKPPTFDGDHNKYEEFGGIRGTIVLLIEG